MKIRTFYQEKYPSDEMGYEIRKDITFGGLFATITTGLNVYEYLGVADSLVRERCFDQLAEMLNEPYDFIYDLWMD